jgi:hypothetical protein
MPIIPAMREVSIGRRIMVQASQAQHETPISKITKVKRSGIVVQVEGLLSSKCEALTSKIPSIAKKKIQPSID